MEYYASNAMYSIKKSTNPWLVREFLLWFTEESLADLLRDSTSSLTELRLNESKIQSSLTKLRHNKCKIYRILHVFVGNTYIIGLHTITLSKKKWRILSNQNVKPVLINKPRRIKLYYMMAYFFRSNILLRENLSFSFKFLKHLCKLSILTIVQ